MTTKMFYGVSREMARTQNFLNDFFFEKKMAHRISL